MNTVFSLCFEDPPPPHAAALAGMCFQEIERLECLLSRYLPDSDITRINQLESAESVRVDPSTHAVLLIALQMHRRSGGLFDISLGNLTEEKEDFCPSDGAFAIHPDRPEVTCIRKGRALDLGGIGKGFALDCAARVLHDLDVDSALISAGASTHLAFGNSAWDINLASDKGGRMIQLRSAALSSSGTAIQGIHVIHPESPDSRTCPQQRVWVVAATGSEADAFSTACLLLESGQLRELVEMEESRIRVFRQTENAEVQAVASTDFDEIEIRQKGRSEGSQGFNRLADR